MPRQRILGQLYHSRQKYVLTTSGVQLIREHYNANRQSSIQYLCEQLHAPAWRIHLWARQNGIQGPHPAVWTENEITDLERYYSVLPLNEVAQRIGRSPIAIQGKCGRLNITKTSEGYTLASVAQAFGCSQRQVANWIARGWLHTMPRQTNRQRDFHYISAAAIRRFVQQHAQDITLIHIDDLWLRDIMAGSRGLGELA